jgi:type IV secretory pathway TrbD component
MSPADHSIPIHRAANRPVLLLGCDRELIGLVIGSSLALIWIGQTWTSVGYGVFLFLFSLGVLRLAAKADPYMRQVYMRSRHYKQTFRTYTVQHRFLAVDLPVHNPQCKFGRIPALQPKHRGCNSLCGVFGYVGNMKLA